MKSTKLVFGLATLGVLLLGTGNRAQAAGSASANLAVGASIAKNCTITTSPVGFPAYDPIVTHATAPDDSTAGSLTVACTKGAAVTIGLGQGQNYSSLNRMTDGTNFLEYTLYQNSPGGTPWSTTGAGLMSVTATKKDPVVYPVYGRILGGQDQPAGTYADTVVATVNF